MADVEKSPCCGIRNRIHRWGVKKIRREREATKKTRRGRNEWLNAYDSVECYIISYATKEDAAISRGTEAKDCCKDKECCDETKGPCHADGDTCKDAAGKKPCGCKEGQDCKCSSGDKCKC